MAGRLDRLAILVGAQERGIERVAREVEVVRIAAERCRAVLGRPGEAHVRILAVGVEVVLPAAEQRHDLAARGLLIRAAGGFEFGDLRVARLGQRLSGRLADRIHHLRGHVGDRGHDFGLLAGAGQFVLAARGRESRIEIVHRVGRIVVETACHAVMVGQDQAFGRNEAGRAAAGQPHGGIADVVEPGLIGRPAVGFADLFGGEPVEGPHAFVGTRLSGGKGQRAERSGGEQDGTAGHGQSPL